MGAGWRDFNVELWDMLLPVWKQRRIQLQRFAFIPPHVLANALWQKDQETFQDVFCAVEGPPLI